MQEMDCVAVAATTTRVQLVNLEPEQPMPRAASIAAASTTSSTGAIAVKMQFAAIVVRSIIVTCHPIQKPIEPKPTGLTAATETY